MIEFYIPQCATPQILVSQTALRLIADGAELHYFGQICKYGRLINEMPINRFLARAYSIFNKNPKDLADAYVLDEQGHVNYFFQLVECGHCELCLSRKRVDMVNRAMLEQQCYTCPPYFITLTYAPGFLPRYGELRYTDVQRFFKRLRRIWDKKGFKHDMRYIVCGEYGKHGHRPHYHILLFNNPYNCDEYMPEHYSLMADVYKAWSVYDPKTGTRRHICEHHCFKCEPCSGGAPGYVTKYMCKDVRKDKHFNKPFVRTSIKNGGIGMPFLRQNLDFYRRCPAMQTIDFISTADASFHQVTMGKYASRHIFPSVSSLVPIKIREAYRECIDLIARLCRCKAMTMEDGYILADQLRPSPFVRNKFSKHFVDSYPLLQHPRGSAFWQHYVSKVRQTLADLADVVQQPFDIDMSIVAAAYKHKELAPPQVDNFGNLASRYFAQRQTQAKTQDMMIF